MRLDREDTIVSPRQNVIERDDPEQNFAHGQLDRQVPGRSFDQAASLRYAQSKILLC